jgi:glutathione synthase/RimK-type ligase-like ATP-grasp enzyme
MTVRSCAFLAMENSEGWSIDVELGIPPLEARGWRVELVAWRRPGIDWNRFDAVYIGTPWDYPEDVEGFLSVLERIDASRAVLVNDLSLVRWNLRKTYLRDLAGRGADVVPSRWLDRYSAADVDRAARALDAERIVLKPVIGANATHAFLLTREEAAAAREQLAATYGERPLIVQPYLAAIESEGEFSLFYFGDELSHAIRKVPKRGDFRVQEEHGASITAVSPEPDLAHAADRVMSLVHPAPAYARCDLVRGADGRWLLMELELIEPSMYLRMHPDAPERFAAAIDRYVRQHTP